MSSGLLPDLRLMHSESVAFRKIGNEILLVPIRTDPKQKLGIFTINNTGAVMWELIDGKRTLAEIINAVVSRFEVDQDRARHDVERFCSDLLSFGAIEVVEPPL